MNESATLFLSNCTADRVLASAGSGRRVAFVVRAEANFECDGFSNSEFVRSARNRTPTVTTGVASRSPIRLVGASRGKKPSRAAGDCNCTRARVRGTRTHGTRRRPFWPNSATSPPLARLRCVVANSADSSAISSSTPFRTTKKTHQRRLDSRRIQLTMRGNREANCKRNCRPSLLSRGVGRSCRRSRRSD
jgi:hypothetical protein